jgi:hypothetical protein
MASHVMAAQGVFWYGELKFVLTAGRNFVTLCDLALQRKWCQLLNRAETIPIYCLKALMSLRVFQ